MEKEVQDSLDGAGFREGGLRRELVCRERSMCQIVTDLQVVISKMSKK